MSLQRDNTAIGAVAIIAIVAALVTTGTDDHQRAIDEQRHYCEMVDLHQRSNGEHGWPNFKEIDCE